MLKLKTMTNTELVTLITKYNNKIPSNEFIICITSLKEQPIINARYNVLPVVFDDELLGNAVLRLEDAFRIFNFIKYKIKDELQKVKDVYLHISCEDSIVNSGAIADWTVEYLGTNLIDKNYFEEKNLFIEPSFLTKNKMYLVQMLVEHFNETKQNMPKIAAELLISKEENVTNELKNICKNYLLQIFKMETNLLTKQI